MLLFDINDRRLQQFFLAGRYPGLALAQRVYEAVSLRSSQHGEGGTLAALKKEMADVGGGKLEVALHMLLGARVLGQDRKHRYRVRERLPSGRDSAASARDVLAKAAAKFDEMSAHDKETLQQMVDYAQSGQCRWRAILDYYGDMPEMDRCGVCDNCVSPPQIDVHATGDIVADHEALTMPQRPEAAIGHIWVPGHAVRVSRYGSGEVAMASDTQVVQFPDGSTRNFLTSRVKPARRNSR